MINVGIADAGADPTVSFMRGKLKSSGATGELFRALRSGEVAASLTRMVAGR